MALREEKLRYLTLFLSREEGGSLKESAAGTLTHDELRNSRMSLDKCLLDKCLALLQGILPTQESNP